MKVARRFSIDNHNRAHFQLGRNFSHPACVGYELLDRCFVTGVEQNGAAGFVPMRVVDEKSLLEAAKWLPAEMIDRGICPVELETVWNHWTR